MTILTKNFTASEMACPCGNCDGGQMNAKFMSRLQTLRDLCDVPLRINSGFRCANHNNAVGGAASSMHLLGRAADIDAPSVEARRKIIEYAAESGMKGIGVGYSFVHVDDRENPARWTYPIPGRQQ